MKRILLLLLFVISLTTSYSQYLYPEKYDSCHLTSFCLDCGDMQAQHPKSFTNELVNKFNNKKLSKIEGTIEVQVLIDENGKPCLLSSLNQTNVRSKKFNLQNAINSTSYWEPAISKDKRTSSSVSLVLVFENGILSINRIVYDFKKQNNDKLHDPKNLMMRTPELDPRPNLLTVLVRPLPRPVSQVPREQTPLSYLSELQIPGSARARGSLV